MSNAEIRILGVRVDRLNQQQCLEQITAWLEEERGPRPRQVITLNPEGVMLAQGDAGFQRIIDQAALVTPDGNGLLWAAGQLGMSLPERVTGVDLLQALCQLAADRGWRVFLLGSQPGVAAEAAARLEQRYPGLKVAGTDNGYFREREAELLAALRASDTDILFAGLGMPFQERWLDQHGAELGCGLCMGVGGSFDVISGRVRRAPARWQRLRLEWLWRLASDPRRWRRYLAIPRFMRAVRQEARRRRSSAAAR